MVAFTAIIFFNEEVTFLKIMAIFLISAGTIGIGFSRFYNKKRFLNSDFKPFFLIVITSLFISGYTLNDAYGVIKNKNAFSFIGWSLFGSGVMTLIISFFHLRREVTGMLKNHFLAWGLAGLMSAAAYILVMWAVTKTSIALVVPLREIGIIFALFLGKLFFKEKVTPFSFNCLLFDNTRSTAH